MKRYTARNGHEYVKVLASYAMPPEDYATLKRQAKDNGLTVREWLDNFLADHLQSFLDGSGECQAWND